jgi:hypothetical protein
MKYKIGQRLLHKFMVIDDEELKEQPSDAEITGLVLLDNGFWEYGVKDDMSEYNNQLDTYSEEALEEEFYLKEDQ